MSADSARPFANEHPDRRAQAAVAGSIDFARSPKRRKIDCAGNAEITDRRQQVRGGRGSRSYDAR
jgi:hypothetical protein